MRFACGRTRTNSLCISTCNHSELNRSVEKRPDLRALFLYQGPRDSHKDPKAKAKFHSKDAKIRGKSKICLYGLCGLAVKMILWDLLVEFPCL
jgi:hypothetical protein